MQLKKQSTNTEQTKQSDHAKQATQGKQTKKDRARNTIMQAAKEIIHEKGYEALTVRSLAEATGYSHTNLYYYFKDLNALFWTLRLDMIEDMIGELTTIPGTNKNAEEEIIATFANYADYFFQHPNVFRFFYFYPFIKPEGNEDYSQLEARLGGMWQTTFHRLVQDEVLRADQVEIAAKTIIYALQGMILLSLSSNGSLNPESVKEELSKLVAYLLKKD